MDLESGVQEEERDFKKVFDMFRKRNFKSDAGQAVKNSTYQLAYNLSLKFGSLLFTIIIARILLPDRMGLYSLALSTIFFLAAFSDLGIGSAFINFVSKSLGKKNLGKAKAYAKILFKWKVKLLAASVIILGVSSYFIANYYYNKPIFFALLAGILYLPAMGLVGFIENMFRASNDFKRPLFKEGIFQILRMALAPAVAFVLIRFGFSNQKVVFGLIMTLTFAYLVSLLYLVIQAKKKIGFLQVDASSLTPSERKNLIAFILPLSAMALSGMFFGYIDTLMLGHYVSERFIAYYGAAFALFGSVTSIIGFAAGGVLPVLARETGKKFDSLFRKVRNFTFGISVLAGIVTYFLAEFVVRIAYGSEYMPAAGVLKFLAVLVVVTSLSGIYDGYFIVKEKTKVLMWLLIISTVVNVVLNILGITYGIRNYGEIGGIYGACFATIFSRMFYLIGAVILKGKKGN